MSTEEQQFELFDNYLEGTLSPEEHEAFEKKLKEDSGFSNAFSLFREMSNYLEHDVSEEKGSFTANLKNIGDDYFNELVDEVTEETKTVIPKESKVIKMRPMYFSMAAAIALLIGFFVYQNYGNVLPGDFTYSESISLTERGNTNETLKNSEDAFNTKAYEEAIGHFSTLLTTDPTNVELQFYKALSHDAILQFDEADALFSRIISSSSAYKYKALFYQGISKWKREDTAAAKALLSSIPESSDLFKKAQKALKNIK